MVFDLFFYCVTVKTIYCPALRAECLFSACSNLVPRASFPLTSGRKTRALVFQPLVKGDEALGTRLRLLLQEPVRRLVGPDQLGSLICIRIAPIVVCHVLE